MRLNTILLTTFMLFSTANAKNYFKTHEDMCDGTRIQQCKNNYNSIRNLQITLNKDKKVKANLKEDGKWGEETKAAVISFQEAYKLKHTDGWVGKTTKEKLQIITSFLDIPQFLLYLPRASMLRR